MPITFQAQPGVLINQVNPNTQDGIDLEGSSWIIVDGFEVTAAGRAGIRTVSDGVTNATNVIVRNNYCHDNKEWGIFTSHVDNLLITNNRASNSMVQHGIYVSNACVNPTVRGNRIWGNYAAGLHMNGDISQGGTGVITGALIEQNVIYGNGAGGGSGINCDGVQSSIFRNNLIYDEHASGMSLYQIDAAQPAIDNVVVNNTIVVASDGRWALNINSGSTGNTAYNNILLNLNPNHGSIQIAADSLPGFTSDYNAVVDRFTADQGNTFIDFATWKAMTGQDAHSFISDAASLFMGNGDYHLSPTSPAIDKGTPMDAPSVDLDGTPRPQGNGYDVGAYEYCPNGACAALSLDMGAPIDMSIVPVNNDMSTVPGNNDMIVPLDLGVPIRDIIFVIDEFPPSDGGTKAHDFALANSDASVVGGGTAPAGCGCRVGARGGSLRSMAIAVLLLSSLFLRRRRGRLE